MPSLIGDVCAALRSNYSQPKHIDALVIEKLQDEATVRHRVAALNVEIAKVNATAVEGPPTRLGTLNVDQAVARWRQTRSANPR